MLGARMGPTLASAMVQRETKAVGGLPVDTAIADITQPLPHDETEGLPPRVTTEELNLPDPTTFIGQVARMDPYNRMFMATVLGMPADAFKSIEEYELEARLIRGATEIQKMMEDPNSALSIAVRDNDIPSMIAIGLRYGQLDFSSALSAQNQNNSIQGVLQRQKPKLNSDARPRIDAYFAGSSGMIDENNNFVPPTVEDFEDALSGEGPAFEKLEAIKNAYSNVMNGTAGLEGMGAGGDPNLQAAYRQEAANFILSNYVSPFKVYMTKQLGEGWKLSDDRRSIEILDTRWLKFLGAGPDPASISNLFDFFTDVHVDALEGPLGESWTNARILKEMTGQTSVQGISIGGSLFWGGNEAIPENENGLAMTPQFNPQRPSAGIAPQAEPTPEAQPEAPRIVPGGFAQPGTGARALPSTTTEDFEGLKRAPENLGRMFRGLMEQVAPGLLPEDENNPTSISMASTIGSVTGESVDEVFKRVGTDFDSLSDEIKKVRKR
jgi:hypothetical protein